MKRMPPKDLWKTCARPERVVWAVAEHQGRRSICPLGWKMYTSIRPPMMAISVAPARFTHDLIIGSGEFVLAWPGAALAAATILCGTKSGRDLDKFAAAGLTTFRGEHVATPLINECLGNFECRVTGTLTSGDHTIIAGEVLAIWQQEEPGPVLCSIDDRSGCEVLIEQAGYRLGVVRG